MQKWLFTRQPFSVQKWLYTRLPAPHTKMAIYVAAVFNAKLVIHVYMTAGHIHKIGYLNESRFQYKMVIYTEDKALFRTVFMYTCRYQKG